MVGAVIYVRVSTKEQTENLSLPTQLRACEEYCRRQGYEILERFHEEGESAKTTDRSQLQALLKYCRTHKGKVHFVVVYNLTRFAREKYDHFALRAHLKSLGISLRSATEPIDDTSTGKLMEGVLASFAQFDNDVRSDRTRAGMRAALELGRWTFPADRLSERAEMVRQKPSAGPGTRATHRACVRGPRNGTIHEARSHCPNDRGRLAHATWIGALAAKLRPDGAELDLRRQDREPGLWRVNPRRFRAADRRAHVLSRAGGSRWPRRRRRATTAASSGFSAQGIRAVRDVRPSADGQLVEGPERPLRVLPLPAAVPGGQHQQGDAGRGLRRWARIVAANAWLHAAGQGSNPLRVGAASGWSEGPDDGTATAGECHPAEAGQAGRGVPLRGGDRRHDLRPSTR